MYAMKTILVPTDFSAAAYNAIEYALQIAEKTGSKLSLLHVYQYPVIPTEAPIMIPYQDLEKASLKALHKLEKEIEEKNKQHIKITSHCVCGFPADEINDYALKHKADLIIMGMSGSGFIDEKIIGSTTTTLIRKSKCPVLVIDNEVKYSGLEKIALASDLHDLKNNKILEPLIEIAGLFNSHIYIIHVDAEKETAAEMKKSPAGSILNHKLGEISHSFHSVKNEDVTEGIQAFMNSHKIDLVVMIPRERSIWKTLFQEPNTKRLAFHTKTPMLALHE
jgi:nucleotide-binding universal stress UspA family protein